METIDCGAFQRREKTDGSGEIFDGGADADDEKFSSSGWPRHGSRTVPWVSGSARGPKQDRMLKEITVSIPPLIANFSYTPRPETAAALEDAARKLAEADVSSGKPPDALDRFLIRAESVASSKIESIEALPDDYARALCGAKSNEQAVSVVRAEEAIRILVVAADSGRIELEDLLSAHYRLMENDPHEHGFAGRVRTVQNWILGSDYSPRGAVHVPPPPDSVSDYVSDLLIFANRDDVPVLAQAAIVHAQFETIHPFTDGNGRVGRALINALFRRRGLATGITLPISAALDAQREDYFRLLNDYRVGMLDAFIMSLAHAATAASLEARASAEALRSFPAEWVKMSPSSAGRAARAIVDGLIALPVFKAEDAERLLSGQSEASVHETLKRLEADGVIYEVTARKRNRIWAAKLVMEEQTALIARIGKRVS